MLRWYLIRHKRMNMRGIPKITHAERPSLWSSGHSSWLQIQRFQVRFPALPDFIRSSGSGMRSTQPREDN
jgi:hypothetical protein